MSGSTPKVYGEVLAGGPIDVVAFLRKPLVISRLFSLVDSIVVFSTMSSGGWTVNGKCVLNYVSSNCNFVIFVGVTAMLLALAFLVTDFVIPHISSIQNRKVIVVTDISVACLYSLFWLVSMGVIIGEWWKTSDNIALQMVYWQYSCIQAAAAFSIFSLANWVVILFFATRRFHLGKSELFSTTIDGHYVNNKNFDDISTNRTQNESTSQPYSISGRVSTDGSSNINQANKPTVFY